jgi:hypothetical protein
MPTAMRTIPPVILIIFSAFLNRIALCPREIPKTKADNGALNPIAYEKRLKKAQNTCFCSTAAPRTMKNPGLHGNVIAATAPPKTNPEIPDTRDFDPAGATGTFIFGKEKGNNPRVPMPKRTAIAPATIFQYPPDTLIEDIPKKVTVMPIIKSASTDPTMNKIPDRTASRRSCFWEIEYPAMAPMIGKVQHEQAIALRMPNAKENVTAIGPYPAPSIIDLIEAINSSMVRSFQLRFNYRAFYRLLSRFYMNLARNRMAALLQRMPAAAWFE